MLCPGTDWLMEFVLLCVTLGFIWWAAYDIGIREGYQRGINDYDKLFGYRHWKDTHAKQ